MKRRIVHEKLDKYLITNKTIAIHPFINQWGRVCAEIYEKDAVILVEKKPFRVIKDSCPYYGSTYDGKKDATQIILGRMCFPPIMIDTKLDIFFFPTKSPRKDSCIWLSQPHIDDIISIDRKKVRVIFSNGMDLPIESTSRALKGKLHRAAHYRSVLINRTNRSLEKDREESLESSELIFT
ncbi:competence protein ComK [Fictibacillus halophilus]|uniref:Competence protein ComK n=1 Tax=Fictibacillus halophilus TaxID=1610490 RepID=A0ABV2LIB1_9BACL|nr:competence protein ComK [Fictibacillus halophilus]